MVGAGSSLNSPSLSSPCLHSLVRLCFARSPCSEEIQHDVPELLDKVRRAEDEATMLRAALAKAEEEVAGLRGKVERLQYEYDDEQRLRFLAEAARDTAVYRLQGRRHPLA